MALQVEEGRHDRVGSAWVWAHTVCYTRSWARRGWGETRSAGARRPHLLARVPEAKRRSQMPSQHNQRGARLRSSHSGGRPPPLSSVGDLPALTGARSRGRRQCVGAGHHTTSAAWRGRRAAQRGGCPRTAPPMALTRATPSAWEREDARARRLRVGRPGAIDSPPPQPAARRIASLCEVGSASGRTCACHTSAPRGVSAHSAGYSAQMTRRSSSPQNRQRTHLAPGVGRGAAAHTTTCLHPSALQRSLSSPCPRDTRMWAVKKLAQRRRRRRRYAGAARAA
eukprot:scaffold108495_cov105-Phaeocystis_antarctica.AAC.2